VKEGERHRGRRIKRVRFGVEGGHWRSSKWRSIRGSRRSDDDGSINADEDSGVDGVGEGSCSEVAQWCAVRVNPNHPIARPPFILPPQTLKPPWALTGHMGHWVGHSYGVRPGSHALVGYQIGSRPSFPLRKPVHYYFCFIYFLFSLQFKFSLILNLNLVLIPANLCNPVEISVIEL
jgi:hypothetical protein